MDRHDGRWRIGLIDDDSQQFPERRVAQGDDTLQDSAIGRPVGMTASGAASAARTRSSEMPRSDICSSA